MINVFLYALIAVCGVVLAVLNLGVWSLLAGVSMGVVGAAAAVQQFRRVKRSARP